MALWPGFPHRLHVNAGGLALFEPPPFEMDVMDLAEFSFTSFFLLLMASCFANATSAFLLLL
jgi:hypothetical protein